eukprot:COSAG06_NODE_2010_length_7849_cov_10.582968_2_plen_116_part_00
MLRSSTVMHSAGTQTSMAAQLYVARAASSVSSAAAICVSARRPITTQRACALRSVAASALHLSSKAMKEIRRPVATARSSNGHGPIRRSVPARVPTSRWVCPAVVAHGSHSCRHR